MEEQEEKFKGKNLFGLFTEHNEDTSGAGSWELRFAKYLHRVYINALSPYNAS